MLTRRTLLETTIGALAAASVSTRQLQAEPPSIAEQEQKLREERSAEAVAQQLAAVYGQQLKTLSYIPSMAVIGRLRLAQLTGDEKTAWLCLEQVEGLGERVADREIKPGPEAAGLLALVEAAPLLPRDRRNRHLVILRKAVDSAFDTDAEPLPVMPGHNEMSDSVFMGCPLLAAVGKLTGEERYFDACGNHFAYMQKLCLREDGLYRHSPLCEAAWGRGNGFPALGLTMSLDYLPKDHSAYEKFRTAADKLLTAVLKHADPMVHQVVDHPESYREFSGTAMCAIAALLLEKHRSQDEPRNDERAKWVADAWMELKRRISENGELVDVCESTGKQKSLDDYLRRKAIRGRDDRGGAFALLLATQLMAPPS
jgi:unsaturated rhamnogalacturonyl hydrolase